MQDQSYRQPARPGYVALIRRVLDRLRTTPRTTCWFCGRPLEAGVCASCDAGPAL